MRTVNEVVRDVLANPEAYAHAFPVSTPETGGLNWTNWTIFSDLNAPDVDLSGARLSPEMMEEARQRMLREAVHNYWTDGNTRFVRDESHPRDHATMVNMPLREDGWAARIMERADLQWRENMAALTAIDDPSMGTARHNYVPDAGETLAEATQRPDHYRVSPGRCSCGFTSMFAGDMAQHLEGPVGRSWWTVCECGASALCQQVSIPHRGPFSYSEPVDPSAPPLTDRVWLCQSCYQRRGIR